MVRMLIDRKRLRWSRASEKCSCEKLIGLARSRKNSQQVTKGVNVPLAGRLTGSLNPYKRELSWKMTAFLILIFSLFALIYSKNIVMRKGSDALPAIISKMGFAGGTEVTISVNILTVGVGRPGDEHGKSILPKLNSGQNGEHRRIGCISSMIRRNVAIGRGCLINNMPERSTAGPTLGRPPFGRRGVSPQRPKRISCRMWDLVVKPRIPREQNNGSPSRLNNSKFYCTQTKFSRTTKQTDMFLSTSSATKKKIPIVVFGVLSNLLDQSSVETESKK